MSLISEFYRGEPASILEHCKNAAWNTPLPEDVSENLCLSTNGIAGKHWFFSPDVADLADQVAQVKGLPQTGIDRWVDQVLDGDTTPDTESQIILMADEFVTELGELSDQDVKAIAENFVSAANHEAEESQLRSQERQKLEARKPIKSIPFAIAALFLGILVFQISRSIEWALVVGVVSITAAFVIGPRWRLMRLAHGLSQPPRTEDRPIEALVGQLSEFCRRAKEAKQQVVYEWSL